MFPKELKLVLESLFDGIYIADRHGTGVFVNRAYERITGIPREKLLGKTMRQVVEEGIVSNSVTLKVLEEGKPVTIRQRVETGKEILVTGNPVFSAEGELLWVVTNVRDVSELSMLYEQLQSNQAELSKHQRDESVIAVSASMNEIITEAKRVAQTDSTVLLLGESGAGKEVIANLIHQNSPRAKRPFVKINCAAIPAGFLESELFGYEGGSFTGARRDGKPGLFEIADGGTVFLDEIGDMPFELQAKLLRVLQDYEFYRIGGTTPRKVDVRVISATHQDLSQKIKEKTFRADLFYRLNVVPIQIPPLRERKEDIPVLAYHFLSRYNIQHRKNVGIDPKVIQIFQQYRWEGNVRELANLMERLVITAKGSFITEQDLPATMVRANDIPPKKGLKGYLEEAEKRFLEHALREHRSMRRAAREIGIDQSTFVRKAKKYGLQVN
ncbi:sigma-54 interaction domain-containing protein [Effusibacillus pohliae]|uniref:sigma-54 interaction domain-containing protein n=1 Tax=Effusibacillus pohliae TaxID=232270 RepID=UPI0003679D9C|nr:sigma 54-interacting transcriptional regulator [Effusibacillus pohliae]